MTKFLALFIIAGLVVSCRSARTIQTAISKKDTAVRVSVPADMSNNTNGRKNDTLQFIQTTLSEIDSNQIHFKTFSAKVNVDYRGSEGKTYNLNATLRMYRDSAIWVSANALLGIEAMRVLITNDSVKLLDKLNKTYTARSVSYLQELTALPLDLHTLQDLIIGNPVFLDSNVISYSTGNNVISLLSVGQFFKNLITLDASDKTLMHSKLDDVNMVRSRTADLTYSDYNDKRGVPFSTKRRIVVAEKNRLDIHLDFRQFDFDNGVAFPFSVPRNYDRN